MTRGKLRRWAVAGTGLALVLVVSGCLQDPNAADGGAGPGGGGFAEGGTADGDGTVTILGAFGGPEEAAFLATIEAFEDESGIDIEYVPDQDFTTTILTRVNAGDSPDIGLFPQPGGMLDLAQDGHVQPIDTFLDYDELDRSLIPGILDYASLNGRVYGAPMRFAHKSLVWYRKQAYEQGGYDPQPASVEELTQIADDIKADGTAPWCIAWGSDQATGWVGTDWIEEYMVRLHGPDVYNDWIDHRIPFDDPMVIEAFDAFGELIKGEGNVFGDARSIISTGFGDAMAPAFRSPPECVLHHQGNFAASFYPPDVIENLDNEVGVMTFPPIEGGYAGQPVVGGADMAALFNGDDEEAQEVMQFLTSPEFGAEWAQAGGWLSPHTTFDASNYPDETTRRIAELASEADVFVFDASDVMPKEVGSGTFWTAMVEWLSGDKSSQETASDIESSWPESESDDE
jgi:alpha-glucoside transport system substrate-binding protein